MDKNEFNKDPQAIKEYTVNWLKWLITDTIHTSTWTVPAGITNLGSSFTDTTTTIWLSGGTLHRTYEIVNHIVTHNATAREEDQTLIIHIVEK